MKKLLLIITLVAVTFVWYGFQDGAVKEINYIEKRSNLPAANLTGADLTGANIKGVNFNGVILCYTTMPDGSLNNSSCKN